jgi:hypothetical protein
MRQERTPLDLLEEARSDWSAFQARALLPAGVSADEERLIRQGLAVMRMAQVREPNEGETTPYGQILAALPWRGRRQGKASGTSPGCGMPRMPLLRCPATDMRLRLAPR